MNLYVHFPFCRSKCAYCALHSRAGTQPEERAEYVRGICKALDGLGAADFSTVYFGGGTPAMCDLKHAAERVRRLAAADCEWTVELNPADADAAFLGMLHANGVNRISMGVQSFDDAVLASMGRLHSAEDAEAAFRNVRRAGFANAGIDLIAGWPHSGKDSWRRTLERALALEPDHVSVYTLMLEDGTPLESAVRSGKMPAPSDDAALDAENAAADALEAAGFVRYEISNWAKPGFECRHNLAVWRGEDYTGIGEGARGRAGLARTENGDTVETVSPERDAMERAVFALRTREGLDLVRAAALWPVLSPVLPAWRETLEFHVREGLLDRRGPNVYFPTRRGAEVCDSVIAALPAPG